MAEGKGGDIANAGREQFKRNVSAIREVVLVQKNERPESRPTRSLSIDPIRRQFREALMDVTHKPPEQVAERPEPLPIAGASDAIETDVVETEAQREYLEGMMEGLGFPQGQKLAEIPLRELGEMLESGEQGKSFKTSFEQAQPILGELSSRNISLGAIGKLLFVIGPEVRQQVLKGLTPTQRIQAEEVLQSQIADVSRHRESYENPELAERSLRMTLEELQGSKLDERQKTELGGLFARYKYDTEMHPEVERERRLQFASQLFELGLSPDQLEPYFDQVSDGSLLKTMFYRTIIDRGDPYDLARAKQNLEFDKFDTDNSIARALKLRPAFKTIYDYKNADPKDRKLDVNLIAESMYKGNLLRADMIDILESIGEEQVERKILQSFFGLVKNSTDNEHPWVKSWRSHPDYKDLSSTLPYPIRKLVGHAADKTPDTQDELDPRYETEYSQNALREEVKAGMPIPNSEDEKDDFGDWMNNETIRKRRGFVTWVASLESLPKDKTERTKALIRSCQEYAKLSLIKKQTLELTVQKVIDEAFQLHYTPAQCHWIIDKLGLAPEQSQKTEDYLYGKAIRSMAGAERQDFPALSENRFIRMWEDDPGFSNWYANELLSQGVATNPDELRRNRAIVRAQRTIENYNKAVASLGNRGGVQERVWRLWNEEIAKELLRGGIKREKLEEFLKPMQDEGREAVIEQFEEKDSSPEESRKREQKKKLLGEIDSDIETANPDVFEMTNAQNIIDRAVQILRLGGLRPQSELKLGRKMDEFINSDPRIAQTFAEAYSKKVDEFSSSEKLDELLLLVSTTDLLGFYQNDSIPGLNAWIDLTAPELVYMKSQHGSIDSAMQRIWDKPTNKLKGMGQKAIARVLKGKSGGGHSGAHH